MRVFFIDPNNDTAQVNYPLIERLGQKGIGIWYFSTINRWDSGYYNSKYRINFINLFFKTANKISKVALRRIAKIMVYPFNLLILLFFIIKKKPSIIHFNNITLPAFDLIFIQMLRLMKIKIVLTLHNYKDHDREHVSWLKIEVMRKVNTIICLSEFTKNQFPENLKHKVVVIQHGNTYEKEIALYLKNQKKLEPKENYQLLFFGLIRPYKGIENLIEAYVLLPNDIKSRIKIEIIGNVLNSRYLEFLSSKISSTKDIKIINKFLEYSEIIESIQTSDIGILPYLSATQSGVPYLYAGLFKPMIVSNVGALPEQVDSSFSEVCEPNPEALSNAIVNMVNKLDNQKIKKESIKNYNKLNEFNNIVNEYIKLYQSF